MDNRSNISTSHTGQNLEEESGAFIYRHVTPYDYVKSYSKRLKYFYSRQIKKAVELIKRYKARIVNVLQFEFINEYKGFPFPKTPVITKNDKSMSIIDQLQWSLIPFWAKDDSIKHIH